LFVLFGFVSVTDVNMWLSYLWAAVWCGTDRKAGYNREDDKVGVVKSE